MKGRLAMALQLEQIKPALLKAQWIAAGGDRRAAADALGIGYTNAVETLREAGIPLRGSPTQELVDDSIRELMTIGDAVKQLVTKLKKAHVADADA